MSPVPSENFIDPRVEIRKSHVEGNGSFATAPIKKGEVVIVWGGGVIVSHEEFEKGFAEGIYQPETAIHYDKDHKWAQLASDNDEQDAFLNHSCDPNVWFTNGWPLTARRDINAGEELTFDYSTGETYPLHSECQCGSNDCRHHVTGKEWQDPAFQEKYIGHFNPYIQSLIDNK